MRLIDADKLCLPPEDIGSRMAVALAPTVNEWIPVSERLPEEEKQYLCVKETPLIGGLYYRLCYYAKDLYRIDDYDFNHRKGVSGFYTYDSEYGYIEINDIIAWMPIPEYGGDNNEKEI